MARAEARSALPRNLDAFVCWHDTQPERCAFVDVTLAMDTIDRGVIDG